MRETSRVHADGGGGDDGCHGYCAGRAPLWPSVFSMTKCSVVRRTSVG